MPYDLTDRIIQKQKADRERERQRALSTLKDILEELSPKYCFSRVYIFGSIVKPGRFRRDSDIGIAIFDLKDEYFFRLMAEISRRLGRNVEIRQIETVDERLRRSIEKGMLWIRRKKMGLLPRIEFEKYKLSNGLDVILHGDHSIPLIAVNIWYHVGSKNEKPGRTGFAHLFEHMMFEGSQHHDSEYFEPLEKIGGAINGSTSEDHTNYWENVPGNYLELALWLESDRMGFLLPSMTQEKLDNQRDVVKNERRQMLDNRPYGKVYEILPPLLYPDDHPYSWTVIGSMADLSAASLEDVSQFFRTYYTPSNASLCIAGDFDPSAAREMVEKYFSSIPPGPPVDSLSCWIPELDGVKRAVAEDNVRLPRLYHVWHTPAQYTPGDAEFVILADILSTGKTSRLYRKLVYELQIAQDVNVYQSSCELGSQFMVVATAREGHALEELEEAMDAELERLVTGGITPEELEQAQTTREAGFVRHLEQIGGFGGKADQLNNYNIMLGDPGKFQWDLDRYTKATVEDVQEYASRYLSPDRRVILHVLPQGDLTAAMVELDRAIEPEPSAEPSFAPPRIERGELSNGLEVLVVSDPKLPLVQANVVFKGGWSADPMDLLGTASLTAELIDEGTRSRTALQIDEEVKQLGADLGTYSSFDSSSVTLNVLKRNLGPGLELLADIVLNPTFPEEELERQRKIYLGRIQQESKESFTVARKLYSLMLYGTEHPYSQPFTGSGTEESINKITRSDLVKYYEANFFPNNAAAVMVGDITLDEAKEKLEEAFAAWKPGNVVQREVPEPPALTSTKVYIADKPGAAQSAIVAGNVGVSRKDPNYIACQVMNNAFGGQFTSRLNMNLREDKGYTYGAGSYFFVTRGLGPFMCYTQVQTEITREALAEIMKEMSHIVGPRPLTDTELIDSKNNLIKSFPQRFQTFSGIAGQLGGLFAYELPDDELETYISRIDAVDGPMATKAAKDHLHPDALLIMIVGDREKLEQRIRELGLGELYIIDAEGNAVE